MKLFKNKILLSFVVFCMAFQWMLPVAQAQTHTTASPMVADFLCEKGLNYYEEGKFPKALQEFKKALLANPESAVAREYVGIIEGINTKKQADVLETFSSERLSEGVVVLNSGDKIYMYDEALKEFESQGTNQAVYSARTKDLSQIITEFQNEVIPRIKNKGVSKQVYKTDKVAEKQDTAGQYSEDRKVVVQQSLDTARSPQKSPLSLGQKTEEIHLDLEQYKGSGNSIDIETFLGNRFVVESTRILKYVVTEQEFLRVSRLSENKILVETLNVGASHLHVWDDSGRKSLRFDIKPRRYDLELKQAAQKEGKIDSYVPESFKMSYSVDGSSFMTGRGFGDLHRSSYSWAYRWGLRGETPFGNFDSAIQGSRTLQKTYKVSNLRLALTDAHYSQFKDITIRGFDFTPSFGAFGFPSSDLRGIMIKAPMFEKRLDYMAFWGALPQGGYTSLSTNSGFSPTKKAWLEGVGVNYKISKAAHLKTFYAHSYGPERSEPVLTSDVAGADLTYNLGKFRMGSSVVSDMRYLSYKANCSVSLSKFYAGLSMMDTNKNFRSLLGGNPASGSTSGTLSLVYQPVPSLVVSNNFSGYHDKVFGNPESPGRANYNNTTQVNWAYDRHTDVQLTYIMDDQMGSNSPSVRETKSVTFRKKLFFIKKLNVFATYSNSKSKNYSSPANDYNNNRVLAGLSSQIIENLYFYYNQEINFLYNKFTQERANPTAQEVGLQYNRQVFDWPLYVNARVFYRDEQNTESVLSYLSGQDRFETDGEVTFKPNKDSEVFLRCRVANIWAEKEGVDKHFDLSLNWGVRFLWDTGLRWDTVGNFDGFVFYDLNGDGLMQAGEKGVAGVIVVGPSDKTAKTNDSGYYKLSHISGRSASVELDLSTIPKKYNPTTPVTQKCDITYGKTNRVNFGIATRSDIDGLVFDDKNKNGQYDTGEPLIQGVIIVLDKEEKIVSNLMGAFRFRNLVPGEHMISIDLKSIPIKFVPKVPISKKINLEEGTAFSYPIPLEETK
ncbi:MAG: SdrD B-like domain-containing protein [Candidatus Omnitrophota bacterium]